MRPCSQVLRSEAFGGHAIWHAHEGACGCVVRRSHHHFQVQWSFYLPRRVLQDHLCDGTKVGGVVWCVWIVWCVVCVRVCGVVWGSVVWCSVVCVVLCAVMFVWCGDFVWFLWCDVTWC